MVSWILRVIAAFLLILVLFPAVASSIPDVTKPNVLLVTIDTLRADYLGCYGNKRVDTPTIDSLAADGTLFERAYCQAPITPPSHASILTGTYPPTHGVRDFTSPGLRRGFPTIASLLKKNGYNTAAFVSAYVLDSVWGLNQGFDTYYDRFEPKDFLGVNPGNVQRKAGETIDLTLNWMRGAERAPYFLWVHLFDPHHDYLPPEPYRSKYAGDLYAGEVAYTDRELGRLIALLRLRQEYEKTLIIVVSDHGEAFGEHEESEHGFFLYNPTLQVPLIVKLPRGHLVSRKVTGIVETVDIAPTVLQVTKTGAGAQTNMQGTGLLSQILGKTAPAQRASYSETLYPRTTFGWSDLAAVTQGRFKFIDAPRPELYDLISDPGERNNLHSGRRALANQMRQQLEQLRRRAAAALQAAPAAALEPERIEALRALGYVGVSAGSSVSRTGNLADPKDRIKIFNKILAALQASDAGALERSNTLLMETLQEEPQLFIAHYSLGLNLLKSGQAQKAVEYLERAKELNPSFDLTDIHRANALVQLGKTDEAIATLRGVLKANPSRLPAKRQLATALSRKGDHAGAIDTYREILKERPDDSQMVRMLGISLTEARRYEEAVDTLRKAVSLGAGDAIVHNQLGIALANSDRPREAVDSYRKALEIKPDYHQARLNLSFTLLKSGREAEAKQEFSILCKTSPRLCEQYQKYFSRTEVKPN